MVGVCGGTSSGVDVGVVCGVAVVLVWCWCSGVGVGGAVVIVLCGGRWRPIKPQETHFSLEGGNCCPNFDSTLVVFYMLTTLYQLTHTLCHIYAYNHSILFCFFLF